MELAELLGPGVRGVWFDDGVVPHRAYALFEDAVPSPALYLEVLPEGSASPVPIIVHNLAYYEMAMRRWDADVVDLLVLNELHELTHWAMTDRERERWDRRSERSGRPDGHWMNPPLFEVIDHVGREGREQVGVVERSSLLERARRWLFDSA